LYYNTTFSFYASGFSPRAPFASLQARETNGLRLVTIRIIDPKAWLSAAPIPDMGLCAGQKIGFEDLEYIQFNFATRKLAPIFITE